METRTKLVGAALAAAAFALPIGALASHGKVGLWEVTTHMSMPNMMANVPPEAMARMKAMGMNMPGNQTYTSQHCMTAEEVTQDRPPPPRNARECSMSHIAHDGHTFTADMTCSGQLQGTGHMEMTFDSDTHYAGNYSFTGSASGHPQNMTYSFEGRWISPDCGDVH